MYTCTVPGVGDRREPGPRHQAALPEVGEGEALHDPGQQLRGQQRGQVRGGVGGSGGLELGELLRPNQAGDALLEPGVKTSQ